MRLDELSGIELAFLVVWIALAIVGTVFFRFSRNAKLKRRLFPRYVVTAWLLVLLYVGYYARSWQMFLLVAIIATLFLSLHIRQVRFCDTCGATSFDTGWFSRPEYCGRCGAPFEAPLRREGPV